MKAFFYFLVLFQISSQSSSTLDFFRAEREGLAISKKENNSRGSQHKVGQINFLSTPQHPNSTIALKDF